MFILCSAFYRLGHRTRDRLRWVQIASQALLLDLSSASDWNQTGFKLDQTAISYPQNAMSTQMAFQVFRVQFPILDRFTSIRWTSGVRTYLGRSSIDFRIAISLSALNSDGRQMGFR